MTVSEESVRRQRACCGNSLCVAALLSREGLQSLARMLETVSKPITNTHFDHEAAVREVHIVQDWYFRQAQCQSMMALEKTVEVLSGVSDFAYIGFDASHSTVGKDMPVNGPVVTAQDRLAKRTLGVVVQLMFYRGMSMSWHAAGWPGQLVLLLSSYMIRRCASPWAACGRMTMP